MKRRKTVCGEKVDEKITQINLKITKAGSKPLTAAPAEGAAEEKPAEKEAPKPVEKKETPKPEPKPAEKPKEEKPAEAPAKKEE